MGKAIASCEILPTVDELVKGTQFSKPKRSHKGFTTVSGAPVENPHYPGKIDMGVRGLDLAKMGCQVKCGFQKNSEYLFSINMSQILHGTKNTF